MTISDKPAFTRVHRRSALHLAFFTARREIHRATITVVVKGTFAIEPGEAARPLDAKDQPPLVGDHHWGDDPTATLRYPTDFAPFKPTCDTLLVGTFRAREEARRGGRVEFGVGKRTKALAIAGPRVWQSGVGGAVPSKPDSVGDVELRYEHAFGGDRYGKNPVGRGFVDTSEDPEGVPLPAIELADALVRSTSDRPEPAGFGPLGYAWAHRAALGGTYDERWRRERWPWYPADFDWAYFNAAPADQQIEGYLRGDERFHFTGLHPHLDRVESKLPGIRPRVFGRRRAGSRGDPFEEAALSLDTMFVDADAMRLTLVWRGALPIEAMRSREFEGLLVVDESLFESPKPRDAYADEAYWQVEKPNLETLADEEEWREATAAATYLPEEGDDEARALAEARELLAAGNASPELIEKLSKVSSIDAFLHVLDAEKPKPSPEDVQRLEEAARAANDDTRARIADAGHDPKVFEGPPPASATPPAGPWTRERVVAHAAEGGSFANQDLSGLDMSEVDLSARNFTGARLDETRLTRAKLDGADLTNASLRDASAEGASFVDACLEGAYAVSANFADADLRHANAARLRAARANFARADLGGADLAKADLEEAVLTEATFEGATADGANLRGASAARLSAAKASLREADLARIDLTDADLGAAVLSGAGLEGARLDGVKAQAILLSHARGAKVSLVGADLTEARASGCKLDASILDGVRAEASIWVGASLQASSLTKALFTRADFTEAELAASSFHFSVMKRANLSHAKLGAAKLTKVDLFQARLEGADLSAADCRGSNFFGCDFVEAIVTHARFDRSNLKRTLLAGKA